MSAMKIKKGDTVKVIAGKDNGKEGKVLAVNAKDNTVVVENIKIIVLILIAREDIGSRYSVLDSLELFALHVEYRGVGGMYDLVLREHGNH